MKKFITALLAAFTLISVSTTAFAEGSQTDCKDFTDFFDADELSRIIEQNSDNRYLADISSAAAVSSRENASVSEYKEYAVTLDFLGELSKGTPLKELLPDDYSWIVSSGNSKAKAILKDGVWKFIGCSYAIPEMIENGEIADDSIRFDAINSAIEAITSNGSKVTDIVCVDVTDSYTYLVCIVSDNAYAIPFSARPDFTGLVNGKLYKASDVYDTLAQTLVGRKSARNIEAEYEKYADYLKALNIDDPQVISDLLHEYGGGSALPANLTDAQPVKSTSMPILPIIVIPAAAVAIAITVSLLIWNKGSRKHTK